MIRRDVANFAPCAPLSVICLMLSFVLLAVPFDIHSAYSQVTPTPGAGGLGTQVNRVGNVYEIAQGTRAGSNLFHSFNDFSIAAAETARFQPTLLNPTPALDVLNILGRVTGGNPSSIFGSIDSATYYPSGNLFLMNPAGVIFGPTATLNVGGMATFTTADYLRLQAGNGNGIFYANPAQASLLTSAPVSAFGFLGSNPAAISLQGSQLSVAVGTGLSLVGGPIEIKAGNLPDDTVQPALLSAPTGQMTLASVASPGEMLIGSLEMAPNVNGQSFSTMSRISLTEGSVLSVTGDGGGTVRIRGGQLTLDNQAAIVADTTGTIDGAPTAISVNVTDGVSLNNMSSFTAWATSAGRSGNIEVTGRTIDVAGGSVVYTNSTDAGTPGSITATATEVVSVRGTDLNGNPSDILSESLGLASSGSVTVRAPVIDLDMGAIETRMFGLGEGVRAGDITVEATQLRLVNGGKINTVSGSGAPTGNISITVEDSINLMGTTEFGTTSTITNENISGATGTITIQAGSLSLSDQARILNQTGFDVDPAPAITPKITITADSSIALSTGSRIDVTGFFSDTGSLELSGKSLTMSGASSITTLSNASGAGGPIVINVQDLAVTEGSQIVSSSSLGLGRGGDITVNATGSVLVTGQATDPFGTQLASGLLSNTISTLEDPMFTGNAGNISITGQSIQVSNGARIDSSSQGLVLGNAGNIDLAASTITVNGGTISTSTEFAGQAGTITLHADSLTVNNGGQLTSSSLIRQVPFFEGDIILPPTGNAGNITVQGLTSPAQSVVIDGTGSGIFTNTEGAGAGGNVFVNANSVTLQSGGTITASTAGPGNAGAVHVEATQAITLTDRAIISGASENLLSDAQGNGGVITLHAPQISISGGALVSSSTTGPGNAGDVVLEVQTLMLSGGGGQGGRVITNTQGPGQGGSITVRGLNGTESAAEMVQLANGSRVLAQTVGGLTGEEGNAGSILVRTASLQLDGASQLSTAAQDSAGGAGTVTVEAMDAIQLNGSSSITSNSAGASFGPAGNVTLTASTIALTGASVISTGTEFVGNAGNVTINTQTLSLTEGSQVSSNSGPLLLPEFPSGAAGSVTVQGLSSPAQSVLINGSGSGIFTATQGSGAGGDITVSAQAVALQNNAQISSSSTGSGIAGNIDINAGNQLTMSNSSVTTEATQSSGGIIKITTDPNGTVQLSNSTISASVLNGTGGGGSVNIDPQFVILQNSQIKANADQGSGGNIFISITNGGLFLPDANSRVTASSGNPALDGTVIIQSPNAPAGGKIQPLGKAPLQVTALLTQRCAAIARGEVSSFVVAGRDTLPTEPGGWLPSPLAFGASEAGSAVEAGMPVMKSLPDSQALVSLRRLPSASKVAQFVADDFFADCRS